MSRKIFLSFLGATPYNLVNYTYNDQQYATPYAPVAALQALKAQRDWAPQAVFFFLTTAAEKAHWQPYTHTNKDREGKVLSVENRIGLEQTIVQLCGNEPQYKSIGNGETETEVWDIFRTMMDCVEENDEIVLDVTLGFRVSPMLMLAFVDYAHFLKKVSVKAIFYGAYQPWTDPHNAQLWDMISFVELQRWTRAADFFINTGNATELASIMREKTNYGAMGDQIEQISLQFQTARGKAIVKSVEINDLKKSLNEYAQSQQDNKPIKDLVAAISAKINKFEKKQTKGSKLRVVIKNALNAVQWCIDHNLTQQGFTLLQEGIISILISATDKDYHNDKYRMAVSAAFTCYKKPRAEWWGDDAHKNKIHSLVSHPKHKALLHLFNPDECTENLDNILLYKSISICRNSLNHAGYTDNKTPAELQNDLVKYYTITTQICAIIMADKLSDNPNKTYF